MVHRAHTTMLLFVMSLSIGGLSIFGWTMTFLLGDGVVDRVIEIYVMPNLYPVAYDVSSHFAVCPAQRCNNWPCADSTRIWRKESPVSIVIYRAKKKQERKYTHIQTPRIPFDVAILFLIIPFLPLAISLFPNHKIGRWCESHSHRCYHSCHRLCLCVSFSLFRSTSHHMIYHAIKHHTT